MAVVFPYVKNTAWADGSGGGTPITAAKLNVYEDGLFNAHQQPAVCVFHNANQSIANNTITALAFNSERYDQAGGAASTQHDTVTNNSRLTCRYAGVYAIAATISWTANGTGHRRIELRLNATTVIASDTRTSIGAGLPTEQHVGRHYALAVNDFVEVRVLQDSTISLNALVTGNLSPEFMMVRVA